MTSYGINDSNKTPGIAMGFNHELLHYYRYWPLLTAYPLLPIIDRYGRKGR